MLLKLAWRNIWRNRRRTIISLLALAMGVAAIVSIHSFQAAANQEMIRGLTRGFVGHIQVHGLGYQESPDIANLVAEPKAVAAKLSAAWPAAQLEQRVIGAGLAGTSETATAVAIMGVEPESASARALFRIETGSALSATPDARQAVVGKGLASELGLSPGSELVLVGQAADGSLANDRFTVVGTADAGSYEANASTVFLTLADAQSFLALGDGVHHLVVRLGDDDELGPPVASMRSALDSQAFEVLPWTEMLPELKGAMDAKARNQRLIDVIVFLIVSLGVLNTMSMAMFERTRELGVMAALGTRRGRILGMVVTEALLQGLLGFGLGLVVAFGLMHGIGTIDFANLGGGADMMGAQLPEKLVLRLHPGSVASAAVTAALTMLAGSLWPAIRASRLQPIEATRYV